MVGEKLGGSITRFVLRQYEVAQGAGTLSFLLLDRPIVVAGVEHPLLLQYENEASYPGILLAREDLERMLRELPA